MFLLGCVGIISVGCVLVICTVSLCWCLVTCVLLRFVQIAVAVASGQCIHSFCNALTIMEREGKYADYVEVLVGLLLPGVRTETPRSEILERQWRQLLVVAHVFALNYIEVCRCICCDCDCYGLRDECGAGVQEGRFGPALLLLKRIEELLSEDMMLDARIAKEIRAFVDDGYSFYYYSRGRCGGCVALCFACV